MVRCLNDAFLECFSQHGSSSQIFSVLAFLRVASQNSIEPCQEVRENDNLKRGSRAAIIAQHCTDSSG